MKKKQVLLVFMLLFSVAPGFSQMMEAPEWTATTDPDDFEKGDEVVLQLAAEIHKDWYMYSNDFDPDLGPMLTEFNFKENETYELVGDINPVGQKKKFDELWGGEYTYFTKIARFEQKIKVLAGQPEIKAEVSYQICSDVNGQCIPFETEVVLNPKETAENNAVVKNDEKINQREGDIQVKKLEPFTNKFKTEEQEDDLASLAMFFLISFGAGLAALITPCVFPMIPMTVTYFTKSGGDRKKGIFNALLYGLSIVSIYTIIGTVFSLIFGAGFANFLSTHWLPNLFFFAIFLLFALSFFGLFEIRLPNKMVNNIDSQANRGGLLGIFFMAFTLVLVGFSCTGPIAGTILLQAASGEAIKPLVGMLGFSIAFAIPFTLFAIFPGWLKSLPKSGGWLNTVKVILGFLELALALKFLSIVDQVYHWNLLDREIYLALWIVIFTLLGFYLLGKLVFPHETKKEHTTAFRMIGSVLVFSFVIYLIPGLLGAPLKPLAGYLPPMSTQDFKIVDNQGGVESERQQLVGCDQPKYDDLLELPHGLQGYFDYDQALECARKEDKPIFIDFTGHGCVNCREMEATVWSDPEVLKILKEDYIVVALYVDEKVELPKNDWYISAYDQKLKKSMGQQNMDFLIQRLNANAQPYYTLVGRDGNLLAAPKGYDLNVDNFISFLEEGTKFYKKNDFGNEQPI